MITVAVIAILAAVALPSYIDYVTRSRIVEAKTNLTDMRTRLEQYFLDNRAYPDACIAAAAGPAPAGKIYLPAGLKFFTVDLRADGDHLYGHRDRHRQHGRLRLHDRPGQQRAGRRACRRAGPASATRAGSAGRAGNAERRRHTDARGFTLIELMVASAIRRAAAAARHAVVHDLPPQQRDPFDGRVDHQRPAGGEHRGGEPQHATVTFTLAGDGDASWAINVVRDPDDRRASTQPPIQQYSQKEAGRSTRRSRSRRPTSHRSRSTGSAGSTRASGLPNDHLQQIDVDSIVAGEARPLRIIVDDPDARRSDQAARAPDVRSGSGARRARPTRPAGPADMNLRTVEPANRSAAGRRGSYLLEALIAILIFAFGVLGLSACWAARSAPPTTPATGPKRPISRAR